jgi:hypothetical protein
MRTFTAKIRGKKSPKRVLVAPPDARYYLAATGRAMFTDASAS